jgi:FtsH-binding integral membrane protein
LLFFIARATGAPRDCDEALSKGIAMKQCQKCRATYPDDKKFCAKCGVGLVSSGVVGERGSELGISSSTSSSPESRAAPNYLGIVYLVGGLGLTYITVVAVLANAGLQQAAYGLHLPLVVGELALALTLTFLAPRASGPIAALMFLVYAFMTGLAFSVLFLVHNLESEIVRIFFITAGAFGGLSVYATVGKKNLDGLKPPLFMGLAALALAGVVNLSHKGWFWDSYAVILSFVIGCAGVTAFASRTARTWVARAAAMPGAGNDGNDSNGR